MLDSGWGDRAPCGRDRVAGWATARVAPTRASSPSCSGVGATLVVAHAGLPMASFGSVRDAARAWDVISYEGNEAVLDSGWGDRAPCGRNRVAGWATARVAPTRASSPSCSGVGATLAVAHAGLPMASFGSVRDAARAWDVISYEGNEAVLDSGWGDRAPCGRDRVAGWATARVAPTRASSPSCSGVGATLVVAHAIAPAGRAVAHAGFWPSTTREKREQSVRLAIGATPADAFGGMVAAHRLDNMKGRVLADPCGWTCTRGWAHRPAVTLHFAL